MLKYQLGVSVMSFSNSLLLIHAFQWNLAKRLSSEKVCSIFITSIIIDLIEHKMNWKQ
jgi:hypothetical protein